MPHRGSGKKTKRQINPMLDSIFNKTVSSLCEVRKIETLTGPNVEKAFCCTDEGVEARNSVLKDISIECISGFRLNPDLKIATPILLPPPRIVDKRNTHKLPPYPEGCLYRIVAVQGSHEFFYPISMNVITGNQAIFVPQGSAFKCTPQHGDFSFDDSSTYDKEKYPGKGFKRPEKRHILIFDFITDDKELLSRYQSEEIQRASSRLSSSLGNGKSLDLGLIKNLLKNLGLNQK